MNIESSFDVIVLGTGLVESITAAALSKAGFKVAHLDVNPYYGSDEATLSLEELIQWADKRSSTDNDPSHYMASQRNRFTSISYTRVTLPQSRQYAISLLPSMIPAVGPFITSLVSSGVARYGGFRLLEQVGIYHPSGEVKNVPGSKEDVFKNKDMTLLDKRRLMRFLMFAAGEFESKNELIGKEQLPFLEFLSSVFALNQEMATAITYSLTYCVSPSDPTLPALHRIRRYLRSAGRYGPSSFLVGHYGGAGEIAQGFCRTAAVAGGVYILGRPITSISTAPYSPREEVLSQYAITLGDFPDTLTCDLLISSADYIPPHLISTTTCIPPAAEDEAPPVDIARCIAIIDKPITFSSDSTLTDTENSEPTETETDNSLPKLLDTALLVFPPSSLPAGGSSTTSVNVLITGEGSMSTPKGKWIIYISMPISSSSEPNPEQLLRPYLNATLALSRSDSPDPIEPLFSMFYRQHSAPSPPLPSSSSSTSPPILTPLPPSLTPILPESQDIASTNAEAVFWKAVDVLKSLNRRRGRTQAETEEEDVLPDIATFWPPIEADIDDDDDEAGEW